MATASVKSPASINRIVKAFAAKIAEFKATGTNGMVEHTRIIKRVYGSTPNEAAQALCLGIFKEALNEGKGIPVGYTQTEQCRVWLLEQYETANGRVRKHNPFSQREIDILKSFKSVYWTDTRRVGQGSYRVGVYTVYGRNGESFEYCIDFTREGSPVRIVG